MWLIAGLGNPGAKYDETRHNIGFMVLDFLANRHGLAWRQQFGAEVTKRGDCVYVKPMEYMNLSGYAVQRAAHFYKVPAAQVIVVHDELDFPFATLRIKRGGGAGGHNGLRSIIEQLGSRDFLRVRLGVDKPPHREAGASHVLSRFNEDEFSSMPEVLDQAADAVEAIMDLGLDAAMNTFNKRPS